MKYIIPVILLFAFELGCARSQGRGKETAKTVSSIQPSTRASSETGKSLNESTEVPTQVPFGWTFGNELLPPKCFSYPWMSSDNFEAFAEKFGIKDYRDFESNPGMYFGQEILSLEPITPSWGGSIALVNRIDVCMRSEPPLEVKDEMIWQKASEPDDYSAYGYSVLAEVSTNACEKLAPKLSGECESAYVMGVGEETGGSYGWYGHYGIYGMFLLDTKLRVVVPLKFFESKADATAYVKNLHKLL